MAEKGHLVLGSTESQNNVCFRGRTISADHGRTKKNELAPALKNYFNWYCLQVLIM